MLFFFSHLNDEIWIRKTHARDDRVVCGDTLCAWFFSFSQFEIPLLLFHIYLYIYIYIFIYCIKNKPITNGTNAISDKPKCNPFTFRPFERDDILLGQSHRKSHVWCIWWAIQFGLTVYLFKANFFSVWKHASCFRAKRTQKIKEIIIWRRLFGLLRSFVLLLLYLADRRCIPKCSTSNIHQSFFVCLFINLIIRKTAPQLHNYNCKYKYECKYWIIKQIAKSRNKIKTICFICFFHGKKETKSLPCYCTHKNSFKSCWEHVFAFGRFTFAR